MEVHHHPDLHHKQKPWKEYILEFIMTFLAVALGFFAENIREVDSSKMCELYKHLRILCNEAHDALTYIGVLTPKEMIPPTHTDQNLHGAALSYEIRHPLGNIMIAADMLEHKLTDHDLDLLDIIKRNARRINTMLNERIKEESARK